MMQEKNQAMVIVQDEEHKTLGIVTLEDIVEEILGKIYDEFESRENKEM